MTGPLGSAFIEGLSDRQLAALEDVAEGYMIEILTQIADQYADKMLAGAGLLVAAADDQPPPGGVSPDDFAGIPSDVAAAVGQTLIPVVAEVYQSGYGRVRASMIRELNLTIPPVYSLDSVDYLRGMPHVFDQVGEDLWSTVRDQLADGVIAGESIPQLAERVRGAAATTARKATLVARSAVIGAANAGSYAGARASGLDMQKEWLATPDSRTRPTHVAADGDRVDLEAKFVVGGFEADHPGDVTLPPQERYNCRCTLGYVAIRDAGPAGQLVEAPPVRSTVESGRPAVSAPDAHYAVSRWGTADDPASKMTVTQLRDAAKSAGISVPSGLKKPDLIHWLRVWETGNKRTILPPMPKLTAPGQPAGAFVPRWDAPDPLVVSDRTWQGDWNATLGAGKANTGPGGVVIRDLKYNNGYVVQYGRAWRIDGVTYMVETPSEVLSVSDQAEVLRLVGQMRKAHASVPAADQYNSTYSWLLGRNPKDAYWEKKYKIPNFRSGATGGDGGVTIWDRSTLYGDITPYFVRHETGHNVDYIFAEKRSLGSESQAWADAVADDALAWGRTDMRDLLSSKVTPDVDASRPYPRGVSEYGKSSKAEDFAESFDLYITDAGRVGDAILPDYPGVRTPVYFREIYPNRAAILDTLFPDFAAQQIADIAARRAAHRKLYGKPDVDRKAQRAAARKRHAAATKAADVNAALSDLDEYVYQRTDIGAFEARLQEALTGKVVTAAEAGVIRKAVATGDGAKIRAALARVGRKYKLTTDGAAGDIVTMVDVGNPSMRGIGSAWPKPGTEVRIIRRGARWEYDGEVVDLEPALVREVTRLERTQMRNARIDESRALAGLIADVRAEAGRAGAIPSARITTLAGRANLPDSVRVALLAANDKGPDALSRALAAQLRGAKIKAQGVPGRLGTFDVDSMELRGGGALDAGAKVRVIEPAYLGEIDGETIVLRRAIVEPAAPKAVKATKAATKVLKVDETGAAGIRKGRDALDVGAINFDTVRGIPGVSDAERRAVWLYANEAQRINAAIRQGRTNTATIRNLDRVIGRSAIDSDIEVWRGLRSGEQIFGEAGSGNLTGFEWTDQGYLSTSANRNIAARFAGSFGDPAPVILRIVARRGEHAIKVSEWGTGEAVGGQAEMLFGRGVRLRVVRDGGLVQEAGIPVPVRVLDVEIVPAGTPVGASPVDDIAALVRAGDGRVDDVPGYPNVKVVTYPDGRRLVRKDFDPLGNAYTAEDLADSETLGSLLARELGIPAPRVYRDGPTRVYMDFIEGRQGRDLADAEIKTLRQSDRGRLLGLFDAITGNNDRNPGNWFVRSAGEIVPIDNAGIWAPGMVRRWSAGERGPFTASDFAERFARSDASTRYLPKWIADNGIDAAYFDGIRPAIESLRPAFRAAGREDWLNFSLAQLDEIRAAISQR